MTAVVDNSTSACNDGAVASSSTGASASSGTTVQQSATRSATAGIKRKQQPFATASKSTTSSASAAKDGGDVMSKADLQTALQRCPPFGMRPLDLEFTASRRLHNVDWPTERRSRAEACHFLSMLGQKCAITQLAIATASTYFHVFATRCALKDHDAFEMAATCLFLAGKAEERRVRVDHIVDGLFKIKPTFVPERDAFGRPIRKAPPMQDSPEFERMRQKIYAAEEGLLDVVGFEFDVKHPYTYLIHIIKDCVYGPEYADASAEFIRRETKEPGGLAQMAWHFINDSFKLPLCLQYSPAVICVGVVALSIRFRTRDGTLETPVRKSNSDSKPAVPWYEELFGVSKETVDAIAKEIVWVLEYVQQLTTGLPVNAVAPLPPTAAGQTQAAPTVAYPSMPQRPHSQQPAGAAAAPAAAARPTSQYPAYPQMPNTAKRPRVSVNSNDAAATAAKAAAADHFAADFNALKALPQHRGSLTHQVQSRNASISHLAPASISTTNPPSRSSSALSVLTNSASSYDMLDRMMQDQAQESSPSNYDETSSNASDRHRKFSTASMESTTPYVEPISAVSNYSKQTEELSDGEIEPDESVNDVKKVELFELEGYTKRVSNGVIELGRDAVKHASFDAPLHLAYDIS